MDGLTAAAESWDALGDVIRWMSSLADPTRMRTLRLVESRELTVAELCTILQAPQSTVSRHLKVLADEGWVSARPEGPSRLYRMANADVPPAARRLWSLLREQVGQRSVAERDDRRLGCVIAERRSRSEAFFSSSAGQWEKLRRELFGDRFDALALGALLDPDWIVGDLGCGTGPLAEQIAPFVRRVVAVESSRAMIAAARKRFAPLDNVELRRGGLEALPIDDASLDAAVLSLVLHHLADPAGAFREVARTLLPGGRVLVIDMFRHDRVEYQQQMGHVWLGFEPDQILEWLAEAGFDGARVQPLPPESSARGPSLFVASARSTTSARTVTTNRRRSERPRGKRRTP